jgi:hypothetical protein
MFHWNWRDTLYGTIELTFWAGSSFPSPCFLLFNFSTRKQLPVPPHFCYYNSVWIMALMLRQYYLLPAVSRYTRHSCMSISRVTYSRHHDIHGLSLVLYPFNTPLPLVWENKKNASHAPEATYRWPALRSWCKALMSRPSCPRVVCRRPPRPRNQSGQNKLRKLRLPSTHTRDGHDRRPGEQRLAGRGRPVWGRKWLKPTEHGF